MNPVQRLIAEERIAAFLRQRALHVMDESMHQQTVITWCTMKTKLDPESLLQWIYAVPNGGYQLGRAAAGRLIGEGLRTGVFDLGLDVARGGYHGLKIEMKRPAKLNAKGILIPSSAGEVSSDQQRWYMHYERQGYAAHICYGFQEAISVIEEYLGG